MPPPQQMTAPVPCWIAQFWLSPALIAVAVPDVPSTEAGGVTGPKELGPQQTTAPLSARIAQVCS
jgi:hypothetical protein